MAEEVKKQRGTTVWIDPDTLAALESYCGKYGVTKKDFVKYAVEWFDNNEVDITSETTYAHSKDSYEQLKRDKKQLPAVKEQLQTVHSLVESLPEAVSIIKEMPKAMAVAIKENSSNLATHEDMQEQAAKLDKLLDSSKAIQTENSQLVVENERLRARLEEAVRELERCKGLFSKPNEQVISAIKKEFGVKKLNID